MRHGILGSLTALLAGSGIALGQGYYPGYPPPGYYPPPPGWQMPQQMPMQQMPMQQMPMQPMPMQQMPMQMPMQPAPMMMRPVNMPAPGVPMIPPQWNQPRPMVPAPVVRSWGPVGGQQYPGVPMPAPGMPVAAMPVANAPEAVIMIDETGKSAPAAAPAPAGAPEIIVEGAPGVPLPGPDASCPGGNCHVPPPPPPADPERAPRGYDIYGRAEMMYLWLRKQDAVTLFNIAGPRGVTTLDTEDLISPQRMGARFTLGYWFNAAQTFGIEGSGFFLGNRNNHTILGPGSIVARPYLDVNTGREAALLPPAAGLAADLASRTRLFGEELNFRWEVGRWSFGHFDLLLGQRFLQLEESIDIATPVAVNRVISDSFGTHNQFWGAQIGADVEFNWGRYFVNGYAKTALGNLHESVNITGGGFLTRTSNIGHYTRNHFAFVPETGINLGMRLGDHVRVFGGYTIFFINNVVRPEDQIDRGINLVRRVPPGPIFQWNDATFWAQGVNGGLEIRF